MTRDLYSYGLLMWYVLFMEMPFGPDDPSTYARIACDKTGGGDDDVSSRLKEKLCDVAQDPVFVPSTTYIIVSAKVTKSEVLSHVCSMQNTSLHPSTGVGLYLRSSGGLLLDKCCHKYLIFHSNFSTKIMQQSQKASKYRCSGGRYSMPCSSSSK